jgi:ribulose-5-phosphate 4-epimerase/fuculose-1-phosphate aldolase
MSGSKDTNEDKAKVRVELAALYRLVAIHGWADAIYTHISARVPGTADRFLINPYGLYFDEITASSLIEVDAQGVICQETSYKVNPAGFTIHSAIHGARPDAHFVMHLHTRDGIGVAAQEHGLLPLSQHALIVLPRLAMHEYEGIALDHEERERLVEDLGDKQVMLLRNHGTLALGSSAAACWNAMYYLERACSIQIAALSGGLAHARLAPLAAQETVAQQISRGTSAELAWPGALRMLDRLCPDYMN